MPRSVAGDHRLQYQAPILGTVEIARAQEAALQVAILVEHEQRVVAGAAEVTVPDRAFLAAFGIDAIYTPTGGEPIPVRVIARRPDTIVRFGEKRIHAETATFEVRKSEVANPHQCD